MQAEQRFVESETVAWENAGVGVKRQILTFDAKLMMVKVAFDEGSVGAVHSHPHTQMSYVEQGRFEIDIDGIKRQLKAGDAYYIPPNILHGAFCLEAGVLVDVFTPMRDDLVQR